MSDTVDFVVPDDLLPGVVAVAFTWDYDGTPLSTRYSQSDDRVATRFGGKTA